MILDCCENLEQKYIYLQRSHVEEVRCIVRDSGPFLRLFLGISIRLSFQITTLVIIGSRYDMIRVFPLSFLKPSTHAHVVPGGMMQKFSRVSSTDNGYGARNFWVVTTTSRLPILLPTRAAALRLVGAAQSTRESVSRCRW